MFFNFTKMFPSGLYIARLCSLHRSKTQNQSCAHFRQKDENESGGHGLILDPKPRILLAGVCASVADAICQNARRPLAKTE